MKDGYNKVTIQFIYGITNSTVAPFSDRLTIYHKLLIGSTTLSLYGISIATCHRMDLGMHYLRLFAELTEYGKDGYKMMIENKWAEQPPMADDRKKLATEQQ